MKHVFLILFAFSFFTVFSQKATSVKTTIQSATVFMQGAELTTTSKVNVVSGEQEIIFEGLSNFANAQSVQVMTSSDNITILSAVFRLNYLKGKEKDPAYQQLRDSLEILVNELTKIINQKATAQEEQSMLLANKEVGGANSGLNVNELQKALDFFKVRLLQVKTEISMLEIKEKKQNELVVKYRQQLNDRENGRSYPAGELLVKINSTSSANANFRVSYFMQNAGWAPIYDVRVKDIHQQPVLSYKAELYQTSGINWKDVKLTVSTGNPSLGGNQPVLSPWFLTYYEVRRKAKAYRSSDYGGDEMSAPAPAAMQDLVKEDSYKYKQPGVDVQENQLSVEFEIKTPYDIPSDGKAHLVAMNEYDLKAKYKYYAVPKLDKDAFLLARITDWEKLQLIPGNANVFFEGAYVGQTYIDPTSTEDTLSISLGRDKKVVVQRQKIQDFEKDKLIGTSKKQTFAFDYSVRNSKNMAIEIEILDQVPLSQHADIEVKAEEISGAMYKPETGEVKWGLNIPASETKKFKFVYSVKYPKGKKVNL